MKALLIALAMLLAGCVDKPDNIEPVRPFDSQRYLGKWYEIARLDHSFERGLSQVTADYSLRADGGIKVVNRGFDEEKKAWKQSEGKAFFVRASDEAYLKVSFFGPFYGAYIVFDLAPDYSYSLVSGPDKSYFWILSRTPQMDAAMQKRLVGKAQALGYDTSKLIYVKQGVSR